MKHLEGMTDKALEAMNNESEVADKSEVTEVADDSPAPETLDSKSDVSVEDKQPVEVAAKAEATADLSKFQKVSLDGKEWQLEDLKKSILRQEDYTRKTQELAKERQYVENLEYDLDAVRKNPNLATQFKGIYPEKYHKYLSRAVSSEKRESQEEVSPEIAERFQRYDSIIGNFEQKLLADQTKAVDAQLQSIETVMKQKYPYADPVYAYTLAQEGRNRWEQENNQRMPPEQLNEKFMEQFFKQASSYQEELFKKFQTDQVNKVKKSNKAASDIGRGGGTPSAPAQKVRLKDVADYILQDNET